MKLVGKCCVANSILNDIYHPISNNKLWPTIAQTLLLIQSNLESTSMKPIKTTPYNTIHKVENKHSATTNPKSYAVNPQIQTR